MTTTTNHYDLIVIGTEVAGLVAAALVARRGKRVLVVPHGATEGTYRLGGMTLPLGTAPIVHMSTAPVQRVFQELGLLQQIRRQHAPVDGLVSVVLDDHRLDFEPQDRNRSEEFEREWPNDPIDAALDHQQQWRDAVVDVLDQLLASESGWAADSFWGRRFLSRVAGQLPGISTDEFQPLEGGHQLRAIARVFEPWLQHLTPGQLGKAASLRLGALWSLGPEDMPGGSVRLRELLLQRISLHSGEVKPDLRVGELILKRGRVAGITLLGKRDRYGCDHMIIATEPGRLRDDLLPPESIPKSLTMGLDAVEPVGHRFVLHLDIAESGLSPALTPMVLCVPRASETGQHGVGSRFLRIAPIVNDGLRRVSIEAIVSPDTPRDHLREMLLDELDERGVLPFIHPYIRWMHSPHDGREATDGQGHPRADLRSPTSKSPSLPMHALVQVRGTPTLGVGAVPHLSGIKSLYLISRLTLPGLGLEGEFASGSVAASLVTPPARSPFARSPLLSRV